MSFITFQSSSWCKISCPISMQMTSIREEIIRFGWPSTISFVQSIQITWWCWVEDIDITTVCLLNLQLSIKHVLWKKERGNKYLYLSVNIFDQLVQIFKVQKRILVVEIAAESHYYMFSRITNRLKHRLIVIVHTYSS